MKAIKLILVDDHQIVRDGIKSLLGDYAGIEIIGEAGDCYQLFFMLEDQQPDVLLLDISLPKMSGIEVAQKLKNNHPNIKVIMLSMHTNEDFILNALKAGAKGYLPKNTTRKELIAAIQDVNQGKEYFSAEISQIILKSYVKKAQTGTNLDDEDAARLTRRETEVLKLVAEGKQNAEIANELFISTRTVESHRTHIMKKLELNNTVDMVKYAIRHKLIEI